ncbi:hypothetical protein PORCRE_28 [Porphyromonas crevioricanis JCM 15906]|uniref:Uncharacterized protein n=1 Tax=Porphyromonas crevioricanis JCM 15906 TaxID=1305617 RepID=S4NAW7_9PORP|nr:hypothetical protein PORCRE_28 [Porphyromonas crevioricanis JCM 15906]GAD07768.1 hypothetical protein PORCAN_1395 [Porphyromonas crevioricanis JCM 13913]
MANLVIRPHSLLLIRGVFCNSHVALLGSVPCFLTKKQEGKEG